MKQALSAWKQGWSAPENRECLKFSLIATYVLGLIAHAYIFFSDAFSHDSLNAMYADAAENLWKIQLGRILKPLYQLLTRGDVALPWMIGVLSLLWTGLAVFLIVKMFSIAPKQKGLIAAIAGILVTNITISATAATYIYDLDANLLALLLAVLAVYLWDRGSGRHKWWAALPIAGALGLYQSYVSVAIVLMMAVCMLQLMRGVDTGAVFRKGLTGIAVLIAGGGVYYAALRICHAVLHVSSDTGTYNSMELLAQLSPAALAEGIVRAYRSWARFLLEGAAYKYYLPLSAALHVALLCAALAIFAHMAKVRRLKPGARGLLILLAALLPFAMNISCVLSGGLVHQVMSYAVWLSYLLPLLMIHVQQDSLRDGRLTRWATRGIYVIVALLIVGNVQTSNSLYLRKDLEDDATLSLMTRIVISLESRDDFVMEETPVAFVGKSDQNIVADGLQIYSRVTGMGSYGNAMRRDRSVAAAYYPAEKYVRSKLGLPMVFCDDETWTALEASPAVQEMPGYPAEDSIRMIDGVMVVKLGD